MKDEGFALPGKTCVECMGIGDDVEPCADCGVAYCPSCEVAHRKAEHP